MFARSRCFLSLENILCFNIAYLIYCLLIIGHVSAMSLDRMRRQYQQQNDKQLELREFMLPKEAESKIFLNDMELVPAVDGNSDMYLLVPASADSRDQNLQSLNEFNESQNFGNAESNSDMLMLESEDTPAVQTLKLSGDELHAEISDELVANNELHQATDTTAEDTDDRQISNSIINIIAEAVQDTLKKESVLERENSKEEKKEEESVSAGNELSIEDKDNERENSDSSAEESPEREMIGVVMEESNETSAAKIDIEGSPDTEKTDEALQMNFEIQPAIDEFTQQYKKEIEEENAGNIEKTQYDENENEKIDQTKTEVENSKYENNEKDSQILKDLETPIGSEERIHLQVDDGSRVKEEMKSENLELEQSQAAEDLEATDILTTGNKTEDAQVALADKNYIEEVNAEDTQTFEEAAAVSEKTEAEEINNETQASSMENVESLDTSQDDTASENDDISPSVQLSQFVNAVLDDEKHSLEEIQSDESIQSAETNSQSNDESFSQSADKEISPEEESPIADSFEGEKHRYDEMHSADETLIEKTQQSVKVLNEKEVENLMSNSDQNEIELEGHLGKEASQNAQEFQSIEEVDPINKLQSNEDYQNAGKMQVVEHSQIEQEENSQAAEEVQTHSFEDISTIEATHPQSFEDDETDVTHLVEVETQTVVNSHSAVEIAKPVVETQLPVDESHKINEVQPVVSPIELESLVNESKVVEDIQPLTASAEVHQSGTLEIYPVPQEHELFKDKSVEILPTELIPEESHTQQGYEDAATQPFVLLDGSNNLQNVVSVEDNKRNEKPFEDKDSDNNLSDVTNDSKPIKETASTLTTIVEIPTNESLTLQQQAEYNQDQQPTVVETVISTTLQPLNVLDIVLNSFNASFMNQMSNDNNNNNNNNNNSKQNIKEKEEGEEEQVFNTKLRRYDGAQVWRIVVQTDRERKLADELQTKFDGQLWKEVKQEVDYLLKPQVLADAEHHVKAANLSRIVLIDNLQKVIEVENPPAEEIAQLQNRKGYRLTWQAYHRLEDIHGYFDYLAKTYPDICSVEIIGYSIEKRPLKILKISNGNEKNPGIWIDGGMHAREWISPAVVTYIANQIVEGWDDLPAYMRNVNWYVHAVANPDGYEYSHTTDRLWRKNMRSHGRACPGVDLNRNFGYKWGGKGTSANPCSQTYTGSKAFSEPETFYISKFISNFPRDTFMAYLSFHSYGQYILYPWGYDYLITTDMSDLDLVARQAGTIITKSSGAKFTVGSSATTLYPAAGGSDDWAKGIAGIKYSYTIEMGDTGRYGFILPANHIESNGKNGLTFVETVAKVITMGKNGRRRKSKLLKIH